MERGSVDKAQRSPANNLENAPEASEGARLDAIRLQEQLISSLEGERDRLSRELKIQTERREELVDSFVEEFAASMDPKDKDGEAMDQDYFREKFNRKFPGASEEIVDKCVQIELRRVKFETAMEPLSELCEKEGVKARMANNARILSVSGARELHDLKETLERGKT